MWKCLKHKGLACLYFFVANMKLNMPVKMLNSVSKCFCLVWNYEIFQEKYGVTVFQRETKFILLMCEKLFKVSTIGPFLYGRSVLNWYYVPEVYLPMYIFYWIFNISWGDPRSWGQYNSSTNLTWGTEFLRFCLLKILSRINQFAYTISLSEILWKSKFRILQDLVKTNWLIISNVTFCTNQRDQVDISKLRVRGINRSLKLKGLSCSTWNSTILTCATL